MIPCPVSGEKGIDYRISQWFGGNKRTYKRFGMIGHNGVDLAIPIGTPLYAPFDGYVTYGDEGKDGYGKYVMLVSDPVGPDQRKKRIDLGHLSRFSSFSQGQFIGQGDLIALSGNSGFSTGPHTHITYKRLDVLGNTINKDNGYKGAIDVAQYIYEFDVKRILTRV